MYGSSNVFDDVERSAFRKAEKKYKLYYDGTFKSSNKKKQAKQVDLSEVLDFKSILDSYKEDGQLPPGIFTLECDFFSPVFRLKNHPGFYFIPSVLSIEEQSQWIRESLTSFPQPPNRTNHNAIYGPIHDLFDAVKENKILVEENSLASLDFGDNSCINKEDTRKWKFHEKDTATMRGKTCKSITANVLLRKLRWSTLGLQFNWSKVLRFVMTDNPTSRYIRRNYDTSLSQKEIPDALCQLAKRLAAPAMPFGEEFQPEAAIVNYFGLGDTLGGHLDDMEADWSRPIVSMSLGCKAIFLLGGKSREESPVAMFLRSGDVVLMAGEARECFHGVPRIFTDKENADMSPLEFQFSHEDDQVFLEYIRNSRININIRQVF